MDITSLIIQLISGAIGGNVAGAAMNKQGLGPVGNSIAGILGGGLGGQILAALGIGGAAASTGGLDLGTLVSSISGGAVGGAILLIVIAVVRQAMAKSA